MSDQNNPNGEMNDAMPPSVAAAVARLGSAKSSSPEQVEHVMAGVRRRHAADRRRRTVFAVCALAATVLIGISLAWHPRGPAGAAAVAGHGQSSILFELRASDARQLALVGDFNSWDARATPMTRDATTGAWAVSVPLTPGRYLYAFVEDGKRWLPDPKAPLASGDDFARPNSVLIVGTQLASADLP